MCLIQSTKAPKGFAADKSGASGLYCGPRLRKGEVFAYVGLLQNLKDLKFSVVFSKVHMGTSWSTLIHLNRATLNLLYTSLCTGERKAIRKQRCFICSPFYD